MPKKPRVVKPDAGEEKKPRRRRRQYGRMTRLNYLKVSLSEIHEDINEARTRHSYQAAAALRRQARDVRKEIDDMAAAVAAEAAREERRRSSPDELREKLAVVLANLPQTEYVDLLAAVAELRAPVLSLVEEDEDPP